jgi:hypothetical protein
VKRRRKNFSRLRVEGRAVPCRTWDGAHLMLHKSFPPSPALPFTPYLPTHERNNEPQHRTALR